MDVGAKREIYDLMNELTDRHVAIIMISSDLPEVLGMSDRIAVVYEGRLTGILDGQTATQESIMTLATGGVEDMQAQSKTKAASKVDVKKIFSRLGPLLALVVLIILVTVMSPTFVSPANLLNLLRQVSINAVIAFGMTFVILTGGIDLSVGSILALSGAVTASMLTSGFAAPLALTVGLILGAVFGLLNGVLIAYGKAAPFIATLATMTIFRGATYVFTNGNPITGAKMNNSFLFQFMGRGYLFGIPFPIIIMIVVYGVLFVLLHKTAFGRKTYALGGDRNCRSDCRGAHQGCDDADLHDFRLNGSNRRDHSHIAAEFSATGRRYFL